MTDGGFGFGTPLDDADDDPFQDNPPSSTQDLQSPSAPRFPTLSRANVHRHNDNVADSSLSSSSKTKTTSEAPSSPVTKLTRESSTPSSPSCPRLRTSPSPLAMEQGDSPCSPSANAASPNHLHANFLGYRRHQSSPSPFSVKLHNSPASGAASDSDGGGGGRSGGDSANFNDTCDMDAAAAAIDRTVLNNSGLDESSVDMDFCLRQKLAAVDASVTEQTAEMAVEEGAARSAARGPASSIVEGEADARNRDGKKSV